MKFCKMKKGKQCFPFFSKLLLLLEKVYANRGSSKAYEILSQKSV